MSSLSSRSYTFDPRPDFPLLVSVKSYHDPRTTSTDPDALTLVLAHATGYVKEIWEPCLDDLFALVREKGLKVREVWSIEAPNHGAAAESNRKLVEWCYRPVFRWEDYARAVHLVLTGNGTGIDVDFSKRRLVGVGHSMGGIAMMLSTTFTGPKLSFDSLILVDPMLGARSPAGDKVQAMLVAGAEKKDDTWESREEARKGMLKKSQWRAWEGRVFDAFLKHALKPVDERNPEGAVTLTTPKVDAAASFRDFHGSTRAYLFLAYLLKRVPTHVIFGAIGDSLPTPMREDVLNVASGGIDKWASVKLVEGAGHLVTVTHPKELASSMYDALQLTAAASKVDSARSKL